MSDCWVIPGFLSSELRYSAANRFLLWVDKGALVLGLEGKMRLAPNGIDPGPPDGEQMYVGGPLPEWWDASLGVLQGQLVPHGLAVKTFGWDWRKDVYAAGVELAAQIRDTASPTRPAAIAAHSAGGLVARACWSDLVRTGDTDLVRRVVTLGTPHQGTYAPVMLLSGDSSYTADLLYWNNVLGAGLDFSPFLNPIVDWTVADLVDLAATWPALYELFPVPGSPNASADPHRAALTDRALWPRNVGLSRAWLAYSRDVFGPWMLSPQSFPPSWVLTTVGGYGYWTKNILDQPQRLGNPNAVGITNLGDGLVAFDSAIISNSAVYSLRAPHSSLFIETVNSGDLVKWIVEERDPPAPPPPPVEISGVTPVLIGDPPAATVFGTRNVGDPCSGSKCPC